MYKVDYEPTVSYSIQVEEDNCWKAVELKGVDS